MTSKTTVPTGWKQVKLNEIGTFSKGAGVSKAELLPAGLNAIRYGEIYMQHHFQVKKISSFISENSARLSKKIKSGDIIFAGSGETIDEIGKSAAYLNEEDCYAGGDTIIFTPEGCNSLFLAFLLNSGNARKELRELGQGQSVVHIYKKDIEELSISLPPLPEQEKIVEVLEAWDSYLEKLAEVSKLKKKVKRVLREKLILKKNRLINFNEPWGTKEIGELLDYQQPTNYIVQSTEYSDEYETPVLTAGKTFVLGKTNETMGIYNKVPVIIFDDFTTANKFVKFPFKVKSSAMKFLKVKNDKVNLKFVYETMQTIKFSVGEHKRNYISEYQYLSVDIPNIEEQTAIAQILTTADQEIELLEKKKLLVEQQKKFLLNNLITGRIRLPEFIH